MDIKKLLMLLMIGIFMISIVSAWEFDNTISYEKENLKVTLTNANWLGIGDLIGISKDLGTFELKSHTFVDEWKPIGNNEMATWYVFDFLEIYTDGIGDIKIIDLKTGEEIERAYSLHYAITEEINVYGKGDCKILNATSECDPVIIGKRNTTTWLPYNSRDIPSEKITIGVKVSMKYGDQLDIIWKVGGKEVTKHAVVYYVEAHGITLDEDNGVHHGYRGPRIRPNQQITVYNITKDASDESVSGMILWANWTQMTPNTTFVSNVADFVTPVVLNANTDYFLVGSGEGNRGYKTYSTWPIESTTLNWTGSTITNTNQNYTAILDTIVSAYVGVISFAPFITLEAPADAITIIVPTIDLSCTAFDDSGITNVSLLWNGTVDQTNSSGFNNTVYNFTKVISASGFYNWSCQAYDDADSLNNTAEVRELTYTNDLISELKTPIEDYNSSTATITFVGNASDDTTLVNVSLYLNSILNQTNSSGFNATNYSFTTDVEDGNSDWYFEACDSYACVVTEIRNFTVDTIVPIVNDAQNITDLVAHGFPISSIWNYTATDVNIHSCYYNTTEDASLSLITCNASETTAWASGGNKTIQYCANDSVGWETCKETWVYVYELNYTQTDNPDHTGEGVNVTFTLNLSLSNIPTTTATLMLNETFYTVDSTSSTSDYYNFSKTITIPDGYGSVTGLAQLWYWNYTIDGITTNASTTHTNVTVYALAIDNCTAYGEVILNLTLNDEESNTEVNQSAGSNLELDLLLTSVVDPSLTWTYENTWVNDSNVTVCIPLYVLNNSEYYIDFDVGFSSTNRVWEFYFLEDGILNSTKVFDGQTDYIIDFMDLLTADSTSFLFNYFDQDGLPVDDIIVHTFRKYIGEGLFREIERSRADPNGDTILHLVEEDVIYYFLVTQYGIPLYTSSTYTALCQAVPCTIQLEAGGEGAEFTTDWDLIEGGGYIITSSVDDREVNLTYSSDTETTMNFTLYRYESDGSFTIIDTEEDTGTSGVITLDVPLVAGNVSFFASVQQDDLFLSSEWIDFKGNASQFFGSTLALLLAGLIILTLGLVAVSEGAGTIVFVILGIIFSGALGLIYTQLSTGVNIVIYLILIGGLLIWKLNRRKS